MIKIKVIILGELRYQINEKYIENWKSKIIEIDSIDHYSFLENTDIDGWGYSDQIFLELFDKIGQKNEITFFIINAPLEGNFYLRRIGNNACVLSLYETAEILINNSINIEPFIIRNIYEIIMIYKSLKSIPSSVYSVAHDDIRKCLFDMNGIKTDIIHSVIQPNICGECKVKYQKYGLSKELLIQIQKELKCINNLFAYRLFALIKKHPILTFIISSVWGVILNVIASFII